MAIEIGLLLSVIGGFVGLAGWLGNREKRLTKEAQWRGAVDAKLDVIVGIKDNVEQLSATVRSHGERLAKAEASAVQAHRRIDELTGRQAARH